MAAHFTGVGIGASGTYPPTGPGTQFVTLGPGGASYINALGSVFTASQILADPSYLGTPSPNYSFLFRTQDPGSLIGDGNVYLYDGGSGWKMGSPSAGFQAYGGGSYEGNPVVINNLAIVNAGSATLSGVCVGCHIDGGGPMDQAVPGAIGAGGVTILFPKNTTLAPSDGSVLSPSDLTGTPITVVSSASCGTSGFTFGILSGALPAGMNLNTVTGAITGTPTSSGPWAVVIYAQKVSGSTYCWGTASYSGYVWVGGGPTSIGGALITGSGIGATFINAFPPQWQIHRIDLKQRTEERS